MRWRLKGRPKIVDPMRIDEKYAYAEVEIRLVPDGTQTPLSGVMVIDGNLDLREIASSPKYEKEAKAESPDAQQPEITSDENPQLKRE